MGSGNGPAAPAPGQFRVFFIPYFVPSHMIPMADLACAFAARGVDATMVVTPANERLVSDAIERAAGTGHPISILHYPFPAAEVGLAEGIENLAAVPPEEEGKIMHAMFISQGTLERLLREHHPSAVVADCFFRTVLNVARELGIPPVGFNGMGAFTSIVLGQLMQQKPYAGDADPFLVHDIPDKIEMEKSELPNFLRTDEHAEHLEKVENSTREHFGLVVNTFYDLEPAYCEIMREKGFFVGPYSLWSMKMNKLEEGKVVDDNHCLGWLETQETCSVIFVAFGSFNSFSKKQHWELALGLEASGRPFLWALKEKKTSAGREPELLPQGFEERVRGRGLVVKGWVPQVAILNHRATGAFVTHMGWNSLTEGLIAGVPMISWPLAYDQFINEKLVLSVLRVGLSMRNGFRSSLPEEAANRMVKAEVISRVVSRFLPSGCADEEVEALRKRAAVYRSMTREAVEEGGAAYNELTRLIDGLKAFPSKAGQGPSPTISEA